MTVAGAPLVCTGRGTHDKTETDVLVPPVTAGPPPGGARSSQRPLLAGTDLRLPARAEVRCPVCGRSPKLGRRLQRLMIEAVEQGVAEIDISRLPF